MKPESPQRKWPRPTMTSEIWEQKHRGWCLRKRWKQAWTLFVAYKPLNRGIFHSKHPARWWRTLEQWWDERVEQEAELHLSPFSWNASLCRLCLLPLYLSRNSGNKKLVVQIIVAFIDQKLLGNRTGEKQRVCKHNLHEHSGLAGVEKTTRGGEAMNGWPMNLRKTCL